MNLFGSEKLSVHLHDICLGNITSKLNRILVVECEKEERWEMQERYFDFIICNKQPLCYWLTEHLHVK